ncbi:MAG: hypothetical protein HRU41_15370 [Saprospiraceae bacterium]|nr:hypothetical protein [Saprospiraceae bacterium]
MITLQYAERNAQVEEVEDRLKSLSLAFESRTAAQSVNLQLIDGSKQIQGLTAIQAHLDELSQELHQWYYCNC